METKTVAETKKNTAARLPSKKTMNFVRRERKFNAKVMIPGILLLLIVTGGFVKFGILDQTGKKLALYQELSQRQDQLVRLSGILADYDEIQTQYGRYSYGWMDETEISLVNRMDILNLVETKIAPKAVIENFAVNNNALTMNIHGITLEQVSKLVEELENDALVKRVSVNSAEAESASEARISLNIILTNGEENGQ